MLLLCKGSRSRSVTVYQVSKASCVQVFVQWVVVGILLASMCCGAAVWYILYTERRQDAAVQSGLDNIRRVGVLAFSVVSFQELYGSTCNAAAVLASNREKLARFCYQHQGLFQGLACIGYMTCAMQ